MKNTKLETGNSKLDTPRSRSAFFPIFVFRFSIFVFSALWRFVRAVTGDDAYERYLERQQDDGTTEILSRREFYRQRLERRYNSSTPSRCC